MLLYSTLLEQTADWGAGSGFPTAVPPASPSPHVVGATGPWGHYQACLSLTRSPTPAHGTGPCFSPAWGPLSLPQWCCRVLVSSPTDPDPCLQANSPPHPHGPAWPSQAVADPSAPPGLILTPPVGVQPSTASARPHGEVPMDRNSGPPLATVIPHGPWSLAQVLRDRPCPAAMLWLPAPLSQPALSPDRSLLAAASSHFFFLKYCLNIISKLKQKLLERNWETKRSYFLHFVCRKIFTLLWLVIAKPFTVPVCFNTRIKFNLACPYSFFLFFCLFLKVLSHSQLRHNFTFLSQAPQGRGWSPAGSVTACAAFSGEFFSFLGALPPLWQFCCLCLLLCSCLEDFFSSGIMVIKDKQVKSYLGWEKMRAGEKEAQT